ncbi:helix-turn-helix domain-containing protein [Sporolactobacillus terrae]|uniref:helix-turn-helix domain-containing protein n=1 Tax=Sporolactobacillus terrae TaxID=269673 RepID=UPI001CBD89B2|nr:helix-turn-helix domain-containing protein [Sporolactobacillus terrae]UAK18108.1 helix-turn-helix domain-containing protein [Sporolactobacillus terrae]
MVSVSRILTHAEFSKMTAYRVMANNKAEKKTVKAQLLEHIQEFYGEKWNRLKEETRSAVDMLVWFATERGFSFPSSAYLANRYRLSERTIRRIVGDLRDSGDVLVVYRRNPKGNGWKNPVLLFTKHPYFSHWKNLLNLPDVQTNVQTNNAEKSVVSTDEGSKKIPTFPLPIKISKRDDMKYSLLKNLQEKGKQIIPQIIHYTLNELIRISEKKTIVLPDRYLLKSYLSNLTLYENGKEYQITKSYRRKTHSVHKEVIPQWMRDDKQEKKEPEISPEEVKKRAQWLEEYLANC